MAKEFRFFSIPVFYVLSIIDLSDENGTRDRGVEGQTALLHLADRAGAAMGEDLDFRIQRNPEALEMFFGFIIRGDTDHP